jgi:trehalose/maltose hydrolase-like predicted phosphorylase
MTQSPSKPQVQSRSHPTSTNISTRDLIYTDWMLIEPEFDPAKLRARETVFTIGNGYLGTRGSFEEGYPDALPATLVHGVYDDVPGVYTELANCPDWLSLTIVVNGERFRLDRGEILQYERQLDLQYGILSRSIRWRSPIGNTVDLRFDRFASLADHQVLGLRCQITPLDFNGTIEIQSSINAYPDNQGFDHWEQLNRGKMEQGVWLQLRTRTSKIELGMAAKMTAVGTEAIVQVTNPLDYPTLRTTFIATAGQTVGVEKVVTLFTSQDVELPVRVAQSKLASLPSYPVLLDAHQQAWKEFWQASDIEIEGDTEAQLAVRYNLFQLVIGACSHIMGECTDNSRVSVPAKTLSGLGYRGHVFWDTEIFILPFFTLTQPDLARSLLNYRYHTLDGARRKAANSGYQGAMFAWESAATGDEMTPRWSILEDPYAEATRIWCRDSPKERLRQREIHISADIAYAVWQYWQVTGDDIWLRDYGSEICREIVAQLYIPNDADIGSIEQFDGFFQLKDINLNDYEPRDRSIQAVLGMDETNQTQVLKQPDLLMLLYLMRDTPEFPGDVLQKNWDYYAPRTDSTYGSSLCPAIHAILASHLGKTADAYRDFMQAATVDLEDTRGNTADGIHAASAGGVWQALVFGFAGIQLTENGPVAIPHLPPTWTRLKFKLNWRGTWHSFDLSPSVAQAPDIQSEDD